MCCALLALAPGIRARRLCCDWCFAAIACIQLKATVCRRDVRTLIEQMSMRTSPELINFEYCRHVAQLNQRFKVHNGKW